MDDDAHRMPHLPAEDGAVRPDEPGTTAPRLSVRPVCFEVCALPESDPNHRSHVISVERISANVWLVRNGTAYLDHGGQWSMGPGEPETWQEWRARHGFHFASALQRAMEAAPTLSVNGLTPAHWSARAQEESSADLLARG